MTHGAQAVNARKLDHELGMRLVGAHDANGVPTA